MGPERVGVIGLGAIGGSIAWSATRAGLSQVVGFAAGEKQVMDFWRLLGASPVLVDAALYDEAVAWTSQLPQVVSSALAVDVGAQRPERREVRLRCS